MTETESKKLMAILFAAFPVEVKNLGREEYEATKRVYATALIDLDGAHLAKAVDQLIKTCDRLPKIAQIRKACVQIQHGRPRAGGEAWGDVIKALQRYGAARTPNVDFTFDDPLVARCVGALSWSELCRSENPPADRARFIELYEQLTAGEHAQAQISPGATSKVLPRANEQRSLADTVKNLNLRLTDGK